MAPVFFSSPFKWLLPAKVHQGESWVIVRSEDPIGVFDSGIGGLTVASAIQKALPDEIIYYFGDAARCPYGDKTPQQVIDYSIEICDFLVEQRVKMIVIACNTATSAALPVLAHRYSIPVIGVIGPGSRAAVHKKPCHRVGVIGTAVTIASGAYEKEIRRLSQKATVYSYACPKFVPLVEQGLFEGPVVEQVVRDSLAPLLTKQVDTLILGCTHYPLLQGVIQKVMGEHVSLISSATETAIEVKSKLAEESIDQKVKSSSPSTHQYFTTGDAHRMRTALKEWLGIPDSQFHVEMVSLVLPEKVED